MKLRLVLTGLAVLAATHLLFGPEGLQYEKYFRDRTAVWDGTAIDINSKIYAFLLRPAGR